MDVFYVSELTPASLEIADEIGDSTKMFLAFWLWK